MKIESPFSSKNTNGSVKGYDLDSLGTPNVKYQYIKMVDTSNSVGTSSAGSDIDGIVLVSAIDVGAGQIIDTDSRNGIVYNLEKIKTTGAVRVKKIGKERSVVYIPFSNDDSLEPISLSVQGNFDCNDEKDINVLVNRKSDNAQLNIIKDQQGNDIITIDNSVTR